MNIASEAKYLYHLFQYETGEDAEVPPHQRRRHTSGRSRQNSQSESGRHSRHNSQSEAGRRSRQNSESERPRRDGHQTRKVSQSDKNARKETSPQKDHQKGQGQKDHPKVQGQKNQSQKGQAEGHLKSGQSPEKPGSSRQNAQSKNQASKKGQEGSQSGKRTRKTSQSESLKLTTLATDSQPAKVQVQSEVNKELSKESDGKDTAQKLTSN